MNFGEPWKLFVLFTTVLDYKSAVVVLGMTLNCTQQLQERQRRPGHDVKLQSREEEWDPSDCAPIGRPHSQAGSLGTAWIDVQCYGAIHANQVGEPYYCG